MSLADRLENPTPKQPKQPAASRGGSGGQSVSDGLARHQQFQDVALDLAAYSDQRLSSLGGAMISNRKQAVSRFADFMEQLQDGTVDAVLLDEELATRAEKRAKVEAVFTIETKGVELRDFTVKPDLMRSLTGNAFTKALEGI
jgi:hypothetical protein